MEIKLIKRYQGMLWKDRHRSTRVYFFVRSETVLDNLQNRKLRPYNEWRKLLPEVYDKLNITGKVIAKWSQRAGCSCPCSPGFVLNITVNDAEHDASDIYVTL